MRRGDWIWSEHKRQFFFYLFIALSLYVIFFYFEFMFLLVFFSLLSLLLLQLLLLFGSSSCQILVAGTFSCVCVCMCCVWILFWWFKSVAMLVYVLFADKSQELTLPERVTRDFVAKTLINGRTYNTCTDTIKVTNRRKAHSLSHFRIDFSCITSFQKYQATKNTRWKNPAAIHFQQLRDHSDVAPF